LGDRLPTQSSANKKTQQPLAGLVQSTSLTVIKITAANGLAPHSNGSPGWVILEIMNSE